MKKILITGGAGFLGYFVARRLSQDNSNEITLIDNLLRGKSDLELEGLLKRKNVRFVRGDLTDKDFFKSLDRDYEYIYHLAAMIGVKNVLNDPDKVLYTNAVSTINVFEYARDIKALKKIFFSSTSEVYAGTIKHFKGSVPTDESIPLAIDDITGDRTTYALSKMYGESAAFVYGRKYGLPVTIGRFHNVYGPRMGFDHVIPETFLKIAKSAIVDVPSANHTRAFCFVDDAVEFTIRACEEPKTVSQILHIGNPNEEISIKELVSMIAGVMGKKITVRELAPMAGSPARRCPDTKKIETLTKYKAMMPLEEGIRRTYDWYKDKLNASDKKEVYDETRTGRA